MTYQAKNNAFSTLAGSLTNVATTLTVQTGHGDRFPVIASPNHTILTLEDASGNREVVKVTARAGASDSMTIVRAQEGTAARAWAAADSVELRMTAGEVQTLFDHVDKAAAAHAASAISNTPAGNLAATTVQGALNELQTDVDSRELSINAATAKVTPVDADAMGLIDSAASNVLKKVTWSNIKATLKAYFDTLYATATSLTNHTSAATGAHAATAISNTPAGNIAATTVQAAINELDSEKLGSADIGTTVQAYDADIATVTASQAEMEAGTEAALRSMSPLRIKQAIAALAPPAGGLTLLGTLTTTSGTTQTLSGLSLAGYNYLYISFSGCSHSAGTNGQLRLNTINISDSIAAAGVTSGFTIVDLNTGAAFSRVATGGGIGVQQESSGYTNGSTSIAFAWSNAGAFDAGTIKVYGGK